MREYAILCDMLRLNAWTVYAAHGSLWNLILPVCMLRLFFGAHAFSSTSVIRLNFEGAESEKLQMMYLNF
jgi:hypothetical protein